VTDQPGTLQTVARETQSTGAHWDVELTDQIGNILPDLTIGADVAGAEPLEANDGLAHLGVKLHGMGFVIEPEKARELGLGEVDGLEEHIRPYRNGRDIMQQSRDVMVIDLFGLDAEEVRKRFPAVYQHVRDHVKPERDQKKRKSIVSIGGSSPSREARCDLL
jgi:hypothetical protein